MKLFKVGDEVREIGRTQKMTVKGAAGLATTSMSGGRVATSPGKVVCAWTDKRGRFIQREFVESTLELAQQQNAGTAQAPGEYRGWKTLPPNLNEEPTGIWWANGNIEHVATGELEPVALPEKFRSRDDAVRAYILAARARISSKT